MVVAQGPPGRPKDFSGVGVGVVSTEDRRGEKGRRFVLDAHGRGLQTVLGHRGRPFGAVAEFGDGEFGVAQFEGCREVAPESPVGAVREHAGRCHADIMEKTPIVRGGFGADVETAQQSHAPGGLQPGQLSIRHVRHAGEKVMSGGSRTAKQELILGGIGGGGLAGGVRQVDAGFDSFVADPVGISARYGVIGQCDLRQGDESAGSGRPRLQCFRGVRRSGAARADKRDEASGFVLRSPRAGIEVVLPRGPDVSRIVGHSDE